MDGDEEETQLPDLHSLKGMGRGNGAASREAAGEERAGENVSDEFYSRPRSARKQEETCPRVVAMAPSSPRRSQAAIGSWRREEDERESSGEERRGSDS